MFNFLVTRLMTAVVSFMSFHFTLQAKGTEYYALIFSEFLLTGVTLTIVSQVNIISMLESSFTAETGEKWSYYDGFDG